MQKTGFRRFVLPATVALCLSGAAAFAVESSSRVHSIQIEVTPDAATGLTIEQENVGNRLKEDNKVGSVKHLYVIAPKSGQAVMYSTVAGKVTSSGKRLTPRSTIEKYNCGKDCTHIEGQHIYINGVEQITREPIQDDGTYGSSSPYIYWFDANGRYHQLFVTDQTVINISSQPMNFKHVILNVDLMVQDK